MKQSVVLVGHGSKLENSGEALHKVCVSLRKKEPDTFFQVAFLELNSPSIPEAVRLCVDSGAKQVKVLPYFVLGGNHVKNHIPDIMVNVKKEHRGKASIVLCDYLGFHEKIVEVVKERLGCR